MTNSEWRGWIDYHLRACPRSDWPEDREYWDALRRRLDKLGCDLATARAATERVAETPPRYVSQHPDAVCAAVVAIYQERDAHRGSMDGLRERARRGDELRPTEVATLAKIATACRSCRGAGLAIRHAIGDPVRTSTLYCPCDYGRWIKQRHLRTSPDLANRIRDLAEHPHLDSEEYGGPGVDAPYAEPEPAGVPF